MLAVLLYGACVLLWALLSRLVFWHRQCGKNGVDRKSGASGVDGNNITADGGEQERGDGSNTADRSAILHRCCPFLPDKGKDTPSSAKAIWKSLGNLKQCSLRHSMPNFGVSWTAYDWLGTMHGKKVDDMKDLLQALKRKSLIENVGDGHTEIDVHDLWCEFAAAEIEAGKFGDRRRVYKGQRDCSGRLTLDYPSNVEVLKVVDVRDLALDLRGLKRLKSLELLNNWPSVILELNGLGTHENLLVLRCNDIISFDCIAELGCLTKPEVVDLWGFQGDTLPDMTSLQILNLGGSLCLRSICLRNLTNLTDLFVGLGMKLRKLDIPGCRSLRGLTNPSTLSWLEELNVSSCSSIEALPFADPR